MSSQHVFQLKLTPLFSNLIQEESSIHQNVEPILTTPLLLLVMELKMELITLL
jgi:hypothetical protein